MTAEEVRALVLAELDGQWERSNLHRIDLRVCLVPPQRMRMVDTEGGEVAVWLVLHESPALGQGWAVAYDEAAGRFGLAQFVDGYRPLYLGGYGGFFDAFDAM